MSNKSKKTQNGPDPSEPPDWHEMPEPKCMIKLSWEDIWCSAATQDLNLTQAQVCDIFERVADDGIDAEVSGFWNLIDQAIDDAVVRVAATDDDDTEP